MRCSMASKSGTRAHGRWNETVCVSPPLPVRAVGRAERDVGGAVERSGDVLDHLLDEVHHPRVVLVGHVEFEHRELRVVKPREALVAEVLGDLVDAVEAADDAALEVELVGDAQEERHVERVVVRREGPRGGAAVERLEGRRLDLDVPAFVEEAAYGTHHAGALHEHAAHVGVDGHVGVALPVAEFLVGDLVEDARLARPGIDDLLLDGQRAERLGEEHEPRRVHRHLAHPRPKHRALDADDVAEVESLLDERVVEIGADVVAADVDLDLAARVAHVQKRSLAHDAHAHDAPGNRDAVRAFVRVLPLGEAVGGVVEGGEDVGGAGGDVPAVGGEGVDAEVGFEFASVLAALLLLLGEGALGRRGRGAGRGVGHRCRGVRPKNARGRRSAQRAAPKRWRSGEPSGCRAQGLAPDGAPGYVRASALPFTHSRISMRRFAPLLALGLTVALGAGAIGCQNARPSASPSASSPSVAPAPPAAPPLVVTGAVSPGPGAEVPRPIAGLRASLGARTALPATEVFENVQVFRTLTADELLNTMAGFNRSLGVSCTGCHVGGQWASEQKHEKEVARHMARMTAALNAEMDAASGRVETRVTCWTCHRGGEHPETQPK